MLLKESQENDLLIYRCTFQLYVKNASVSVKFPCQFLLQWKTVNEKHSVEGKSRPSSQNSQLAFDQRLALCSQMVYNKRSKQFNKMQSYLNVNLISRSRKDQVKLMGRVLLDLNEIIIDQKYSQLNKYQLSYCSVNAHIILSAALINKEPTNINPNHLDKSSYSDYMSLLIGINKEGNPGHKEIENDQQNSFKMARQNVHADKNRDNKVSKAINNRQVNQSFLSPETTLTSRVQAIRRYKQQYSLQTIKPSNNNFPQTNRNRDVAQNASSSANKRQMRANVRSEDERVYKQHSSRKSSWNAQKLHIKDQIDSNRQKIIELEKKVLRLSAGADEKKHSPQKQDLQKQQLANLIKQINQQQPERIISGYHIAHSPYYQTYYEPNIQALTKQMQELRKIWQQKKDYYQQKISGLTLVLSQKQEKIHLLTLKYDELNKYKYQSELLKDLLGQKEQRQRQAQIQRNQLIKDVSEKEKLLQKLTPLMKMKVEFETAVQAKNYLLEKLRKAQQEADKCRQNYDRIQTAYNIQCQNYDSFKLKQEYIIYGLNKQIEQLKTLLKSMQEQMGIGKHFQNRVEIDWQQNGECEQMKREVKELKMREELYKAKNEQLQHTLVQLEEQLYRYQLTEHQQSFSQQNMLLEQPISQQKGEEQIVRNEIQNERVEIDRLEAQIDLIRRQCQKLQSDKVCVMYEVSCLSKQVEELTAKLQKTQQKLCLQRQEFDFKRQILNRKIEQLEQQSHALQLQILKSKQQNIPIQPTKQDIPYKVFDKNDDSHKTNKLMVIQQFFIKIEPQTSKKDSLILCQVNQQDLVDAGQSLQQVQSQIKVKQHLQKQLSQYFTSQISFKSEASNLPEGPKEDLKRLKVKRIADLNANQQQQYMQAKQTAINDYKTSNDVYIDVEERDRLSYKQYDSLVKELQVLRDDIVAGNNVSQEKQLIGKLQKQIEVLREQMIGTKTLNNQFLQQINQLLTENAILTEQIQLLKHQTTPIKEEKEEENNQLIKVQQQIKQMTRELESFKVLHQQDQSTLQTYRQKIISLGQEASRLDQEVEYYRQYEQEFQQKEKLIAQMGAQKFELEVLMNRNCNQFASINEKLQVEIEELKVRVERYEEEQAGLMEQKKTAEQQRKAVQISKQLLQQQLQMFKKRIEEIRFQDDSQKINNQNKEYYERVIKEKQQETIRMKRSESELRAEVQKLQQLHKVMKQNIELFETELKRLQLQSRDKESIISSKDLEISKEHQIVLSLQKEIEQLKEYIRSSQSLGLNRQYGAQIDMEEAALSIIEMNNQGHQQTQQVQYQHQMVNMDDEDRGILINSTQELKQLQLKSPKQSVHSYIEELIDASEPYNQLQLNQNKQGTTKVSNFYMTVQSNQPLGQHTGEYSSLESHYVFQLSQKDKIINDLKSQILELEASLKQQRVEEMRIKIESLEQTIVKMKCIFREELQKILSQPQKQHLLQSSLSIINEDANEESMVRSSRSMASFKGRSRLLVSSNVEVAELQDRLIQEQESKRQIEAEICRTKQENSQLRKQLEKLEKECYLKNKQFIELMAINDQQKLQAEDIKAKYDSLLSQYQFYRHQYQSSSSCQPFLPFHQLATKSQPLRDQSKHTLQLTYDKDNEICGLKRQLQQCRLRQTELSWTVKDLSMQLHLVWQHLLIARKSTINQNQSIIQDQTFLNAQLSQIKLKSMPYIQSQLINAEPFKVHPLQTASSQKQKLLILLRRNQQFLNLSRALVKLLQAKQQQQLSLNVKQQELIKINLQIQNKIKENQEGLNIYSLLQKFKLLKETILRILQKTEQKDLQIVDQLQIFQKLLKISMKPNLEQFGQNHELNKNISI